jgi:NAD(P)-dependent dehydrogenase (short-subunit alcohol dehydrogenase family)
MDLQLTDKVAIVTGSSKGLGLAWRAILAEGRASRSARGGDAL